MRYPGAPHRPELEGAAQVWELHVYGTMVGMGLKPQAKEWQHRGYGEELLAEAIEGHSRQVLVSLLLSAG